MKLLKCGRFKESDLYGNVTLSSSAMASIEGTIEELKDLQEYLYGKDFILPFVEADEVGENKKGEKIFCEAYDFDIDMINDFKEAYKNFKKVA